ncbi:unnamed protein product [Arctogadus glacialis]
MRATQGRRVRERVAVNSALLRFVFSEVTGRGEWEPTAVLVNSCGFKRFADTSMVWSLRYAQNRLSNAPSRSDPASSSAAL